jgi:hypothetical protein
MIVCWVSMSGGGVDGGPMPIAARIDEPSAAVEAGAGVGRFFESLEGISGPLDKLSDEAFARINRIYRPGLAGGFRFLRIQANIAKRSRTDRAHHGAIRAPGTSIGCRFRH